MGSYKLKDVFILDRDLYLITKKTHPQKLIGKQVLHKKEMKRAFNSTFLELDFDYFPPYYHDLGDVDFGLSLFQLWDFEIEPKTGEIITIAVGDIATSNKTQFPLNNTIITKFTKNEVLK